jgi:phosphoacetylglucosamine mutase
MESTQKAKNQISEKAQKIFDNSFENILTTLEEYDSKLTKIDKEFACGTSGFRYDENELDRVAFRIAIISCIKSQILGGLPVGIMVTASHNKYTDNGFKIAGEAGRMISLYWEGIYTKLVNAKNLSYTLKTSIEELLNSDALVFKNYNKEIQPIVVLACDTRRSSPKLVGIITDCLYILNANFKNYGIQTTPALHFLTLLNQITVNSIGHKSFDFVDSEQYWKFLTNGIMTFNLFYEKIYSKNLVRDEPNKYENEFTMDCCNGIAGYHYKKIIEIFAETVKIHSYNTNYSEITALNDSCGAEYVHKEKNIPVNYFKDAYIKNISYDGDVDRIVYL